MYTVALYTLGCKVAQYETEAIAEKFISEGVSVVPFDSCADAYLINTCTVTAESDRKSRQMIRRAKKRNPSAVIAVVGCYSQLAPEDILELGVDVVIGTDNKLSAVELVLARLGDRELSPCVSVSDVSCSFFEPMTVKSAPRTRAYVKIEDGCESRCSYCAIRLARGRVRSKPREDVIKEVTALAESGVREVVLTGIETGAYGRDLPKGNSLGELICELDSLGVPERIRLGSLAPELVGREFAESVRGVTHLAPHFHLSMQSGSDKVLAAMRRRYNTEMAYESITALRSVFPDAEFTTDMMVGFPGESEEDFEATLAMLERVRFDMLYSFIYSPRKGTPAAEKEDQIPPAVKSARFERLLATQNAIALEKNQPLVQKTLRVLCDGVSKNNPALYAGRTEGNKIAFFEGTPEDTGKYVDFLVERADAFALYGKKI